MSAVELTVASDIKGALISYIRINVELPESFSIGLRYHPKAGAPTVLLRVNGDHGPHKNPDRSRFFEGSHIHEPHGIEMDLTASTVNWAEVPPYAILLTPQILSVTEGWRIFCDRATIEKSD